MGKSFLLSRRYLLLRILAKRDVAAAPLRKEMEPKNVHLVRGLGENASVGLESMASVNQMNSSQRRRQAEPRVNLADICENNNNVTPQLVGRILRAIGDELFNSVNSDDIRNSHSG